MGFGSYYYLTNLIAACFFKKKILIVGIFKLNSDNIVYTDYMGMVKKIKPKNSA